MWFYDTGADVTSSNYISMYLAGSKSVSLGTFDYDLGPGQNGSTYQVGDGNDNISTSIDRTQAWHKLVISTSPQTIEFKVDGTTVATRSGFSGATSVVLSLNAPSWRPAFTSFYDDFEFIPYNAAPVVSAGPDVNLIEGDTFSYTGSFADSDSSSWTATVDYGDGTGIDVLDLNDDKTFLLDHVYENNGTYTAKVNVTDENGATGSDTVLVRVNNAAPIIESFVSSSMEIGGAKAGQAVGVDAVFTDLGILDVHTATVDWGDGTAATSASVVDGGGTGGVSASHVYANGGIYAATLTLRDGDGGVATAMTPVFVTGAGVKNGTLLIVGSAVADFVSIAQSNGNVTVTGYAVGGTKSFQATAVQRIEVQAGNGDDSIVLQPSVLMPARLFGGKGNDRLYGGSGNNVLLGDDGNDSMVGGSNRDLLIGGIGADILMGQGGDDILIAGTTRHDANSAALDAIMSEWTRTDRSQRQRLQALLWGGGLNGTTLLNAFTVQDDDNPDVLWGSGGADWFLLNRVHPTLAKRDILQDFLAAFDGVLTIRP